MTEAKLPEITPIEIKSWVSNVEQFYPVNALKDLPDDADLQTIEAAFNSDRSTLMGIGEALYGAAQWDAWSSYETRIGDCHD